MTVQLTTFFYLMGRREVQYKVFYVISVKDIMKYSLPKKILTQYYISIKPQVSDYEYFLEIEPQ